MLLARAVSAGAEIVAPCEVTGLEIRGGCVAALRTTRGDYACEVLIIAAGVQTPALAAMAGVDVPLVPAPGLLVHTKPLPPLIHRIAVGPGAHFKQFADGRMVIGDDLGPPASIAHDYLQQQPVDFPDDSFRELHQRRLLAEAAGYLPRLIDAPVERLTIGWRPMPKDGYPIVGVANACPNLYVCVTHSGVTLAPILGELASIEILDGVEVEMLAPYRPARFAGR